MRLKYLQRSHHLFQLYTRPNELDHLRFRLHAPQAQHGHDQETRLCPRTSLHKSVPLLPVTRLSSICVNTQTSSSRSSPSCRPISHNSLRPLQGILTTLSSSKISKRIFGGLSRTLLTEPWMPRFSKINV